MHKLLASFLVAAFLMTGVAAAAGPAWRPATTIHVRFVEHFMSGFAPEVDLRPTIRQYRLHVRDQGNRGTCTVFATTFLIEYQKAATPLARGGRNLSEEYLNWAGNRATGEDSDGGFFTKFMSGYHAWGIATTREMPYRAAYDPNHPATPNKATIAAAQAMFPVKYPFTVVKVWDNTTGMTGAELQNTLAILRSGRPVATGIWWLNDALWHNNNNVPTVTVAGVPLLKDYPRSANTGANPPMFDGHSIDLVGFRESPRFPGGGYFIFRNSMGTGFGSDGYGFVSFAYIRSYANDAIAIASQPWHPVRPRLTN